MMNLARKLDTSPSQFVISDGQIREALNTILASESFMRSTRLSELLCYVVEESLAGKGDRIKAFSIAQDVLGRDVNFDQQNDPIVRVEAGRLRKLLGEYYNKTGREDAVRIDIPKGGYSPVFSGHQKPQEPARNKHPLGIAALAVILLIVLGVGWWTGHITKSSAGKSPAADNSIPFLVVLPLTNLSGEHRGENLASGFVESMITQLAKLSGLSVMANASTLEFDKRSVSLQSLRSEFGVSHVLRGSLETKAELIRIRVQLIDASTLETVWADSLDGHENNLWDLQDELANKVTEALSVRIEPTERSYFLHRHSDNVEALTMYRQALMLLIPPNDMTRIISSRNLFERVSELDPEFAGGLAGRAFSHAITVLFLKASSPGTELEQSIALAKQAIDIDPKFGMSYATLAFAFALSGDLEKGLDNARQAAEIESGDAFVQFILGMNLILSSSPENAFTPLSEALRLDPAEPRTPYLNVLGIAQFANGEYSQTIKTFEKNALRGGPRGPHMDVFWAAAYALQGKEYEARALIDKLNKSYPNFPTEPWMRKWLGDSERLNTILELMKGYGLTIRSPGN